MSTNLSKTEKVRLAVKRYPYLIPTYLKPINGFNPSITMGIMRSMLPYRSSIEIECINSLNREKRVISEGLNNREFKRYCSFRIIKKHFKLNHYDDDNNYTNTMFEHRLDISNYKQLLGLYRVLNEMNTVCELNPASGIHIHVDTSHMINKCDDRSYYIELGKYLETRLDDVYSIFDSCYTGEYNKKQVCINHKEGWINIRTSLPTIEFRIGYCTFEYSKIVEWLIACNQIVTDARTHLLKLNLITVREKHKGAPIKRSTKRNRSNHESIGGIGLMNMISAC